MKIEKIISQSRRDFRAKYVCEGCGFYHEASGYDDRNFHDNVIPKAKCPECGKSRNDLIEELVGKPTPTKYQEGEQV